MAQQRRMVYAKVLGSYHLNTLPIEARYLYVGMLVLADDDGRLTADPRYLKGQIFSYDDDVDAARVEELLTALNDKKVVELDEAEWVKESHKHLIQVCNNIPYNMDRSEDLPQPSVNGYKASLMAGQRE